jgi:transposase
MHLQTILNSVYKLKGFVYGQPLWQPDAPIPRLSLPIRPRRGSRPICSGCGERGPGYDRLPQRSYEFIPFWGILVFLLYAPRRVDCRRCGVKVERLPWSDGKSPITTRYAWYLADWAKLLAWSVVAQRFRISWHTVACAVQTAVEWDREHMELEGITAVGIDELAWRKGHTYATVVYQINAGCKRLLWIEEGRKAKTLLKFFRWLGRERSAAIQFVASDMWRAYLKVIARKIPQAIHVLDRFHIMCHLNKSIDQVRARPRR